MTQDAVRKVLITGGAGFIGSHLAEHFCSLGVEVVILDNLRSGHRHNLQGLTAQLVIGSVTDAPLVTDLARGADFVFHLAAMVSVPESMEKPEDCVDTNVHGTLAVLQAARAHKVRKVVLSSTCAIYGDDPEVPKRESMPPAPLSPYAVTKLDGEYYLEMFSRTYGLDTVSLRYFNVFGPRQDPASQYAAVVPIFVHRALRHQDLVIYGDGEQTRDFVYVKDVVAANLLAATSPHMQGVYNVARGGRMTVKDLASTIIETTRSRSTIRHEPARPGEVKHSVADISRLQAAGFSPTTDLSSGLRRTIEFLSQEKTRPAPLPSSTRPGCDAARSGPPPREEQITRWVEIDGLAALQRVEGSGSADLAFDKIGNFSDLQSYTYSKEAKTAAPQQEDRATISAPQATRLVTA